MKLSVLLEITEGILPTGEHLINWFFQICSIPTNCRDGSLEPKTCGGVNKGGGLLYIECDNFLKGLREGFCLPRHQKNFVSNDGLKKPALEASRLVPSQVTFDIDSWYFNLLYQVALRCSHLNCELSG